MTVLQKEAGSVTPPKLALANLAELLTITHISQFVTQWGIAPLALSE
jgi:hypothetical protein